MKNGKVGQLTAVFNRPCFSDSQIITTRQPVIYSGEWQDDNHWVWQGSVNRPDFVITEDNQIAIRAGTLENDSRFAYPALPCYNKIFNALPENINYHINGINRIILPVNGRVERFSDRSKPDNEKLEVPDISGTDIGDIYPRETVIITFLGYVNNLPLTSVRIYPYQLIDNGKQLRYYETLNVSVSIANNSNLSEVRQPVQTRLEKALKLDGPVRRSLPSQVLRKPESHFLYGRSLMRLTVDSTGIYRIYRSTLTDSGAAVKKVDPRTFQLFNRGIEVPIYSINPIILNFTDSAIPTAWRIITTIPLPIKTSIF